MLSSVLLDGARCRAGGTRTGSDEHVQGVIEKEGARTKRGGTNRERGTVRERKKNGGRDR